MALDFSPLQNINPGEAFLQGRQEAQRNALAKTQREQSQLQLQLTRDQLDQARRDRAALDAMAKSFAENGHTGSLDENFDKMIASGIPQYVQIGISGKQKLVEQRRFEQIMGGAAPGAAPAMPTGAPVMTPAAPAGSPVGAALRADLGGAAPTNALAPTPAAPAPVANALAGPVSQINSMRSKRDQLLALGTPQAIAAAKALDTDIVSLQRQHVVGGALVGPGGEVIYQSPEKPQAPPTDIAIMQALGYPLTQAGYAAYREAQRQERLLSPEEEAQRIRVAQAGRQQTTIQLPPQEKAERGERGKLLVKEYEGISNAARLASRTLPALETQERILDSGFKTGFSTEVQKVGASVLSALGVPEATQYATNAEKFLSATQQAVLQKQLEQKGTQTKNDAERIQQTGAQLGNTPDANKFILSVAKAQLKRDIEQRNFYDKWWKENKTYDGAEDAWFSGEGGRSLFDRPELKQYAAPAKASPRTAPAAGVQPYSDAEKERRYQEWKRKQQGTP